MSSNRMGRNPFAKDSKRRPEADSPAEARAEIKAAIAEEAAESRTKTRAARTRKAASGEPTPPGLIEGVLRRTLVDIPAEAYVLGLKIRLLARSVFERS